MWQNFEINLNLNLNLELKVDYFRECLIYSVQGSLSSHINTFQKKRTLYETETLAVVLYGCLSSKRKNH
jgi:hypothetical protein